MINSENIELGIFSDDLYKIGAKLSIISDHILVEMDILNQSGENRCDYAGWAAVLEDAIQDLEIVSKAIKPYDLINEKKQ